jgi:hypothetical protein
LFSKFILAEKKFNVIIYLIKIIYKVCLNSFGFVLNILQIFCVEILKEMKKIEKKIIKCLSKTVQIFSKAAQAQLRETAYAYKEVRWDMYHKVVLALVVSSSARRGEVAGSTPDGHILFCHFGPVVRLVSRTRLSGRGTCLLDRAARQLLSDPPTRSVGPVFVA